MEKYIDLYEFGAYRAGLTEEEIQEYLKRRTGRKYVLALYNKFCKIAGINTGAIGPQGQVLMYRWDVQRFADKLLLEKETYFD